MTARSNRRAPKPRPRVFHHGHAEFSACPEGRVDRERQVRHRNQLEPAVVNAKNFIALEIQACNVALDLLIGCGVTETQVAVVFVERHQMSGNAIAVAGPDGTDRNVHRGLGEFFAFSHVFNLRASTGKPKPECGLPATVR